MKQNLTEKKIDELVVSEAGNDSAWEKPIRVNRKIAFSLDIASTPEIDSDAAVLSGEPVFRGTKVPVSALIDNIEAGASLDEFLNNFPTVKREQAVKILELFKASLHRLMAT